MPPLRADKVEVYVFRRRAGGVQFLALRRAPGSSLGGVWQPVTGGRRRSESVRSAAAREVLEETGLRPLRWWVLETVTLYLDPEDETLVVLPLLAAEVSPSARVTLSSEHDSWRFVGARAAAQLYLWDSQRRGLEAVRRQVLENPTLARALRLPAPSDDAASERSPRPRQGRTISGRRRRSTRGTRYR